MLRQLSFIILLKIEVVGSGSALIANRDNGYTCTNLRLFGQTFKLGPFGEDTVASGSTRKQDNCALIRCKLGADGGAK